MCCHDSGLAISWRIMFIISSEVSSVAKEKLSSSIYFWKWLEFSNSDLAGTLCVFIKK